MEYCAQYAALISAAVDGELTQAERSELMDHLERCPACRAAYSEMMAMHAAFSQLDAELPGDLAGDVMAKVRAQRQIKKPRHAWWQMAAAAACLARVVLGYQHLGAGAPGANTAGSGDALPYAADVQQEAAQDAPLEKGLSQADAEMPGYASNAVLQDSEADAAEEAASEEAIMEEVLTYFRSGAEAASAPAAAAAEAGGEGIPCPTLSSGAAELERWIAENIPAEGYGDTGARAWLITPAECEALTEYLDAAGVPYTLDGALPQAGAEEGVVCVVYLEDAAA